MGKMNMKDVFTSFAGKKIFVTGHTGFKGTWLTFILSEIGAEVMGYALEPELEYSHFNKLNLRSKIKHFVGDVRDAKKLADAMQSFQPEYVIHMAAQPLVKKSYASPAETFEVNVMGSVNLLDAVRSCESVKSLVYITSDKCYENVEWIWGYRENDRLGGHDPYSASKGAAEVVFSAYARSYFSSRSTLGAATVRAGNVIGGGDWAADRIIPDCMRAIEKGLPIQLRNPNATRPWQHVLEPLSGYLQLSAQLYSEPSAFSGAWNFGPSTSEIRTVHEVAEKIIAHLNKGRIEITGSLNQPHEANLLQLNCDKAHQLLGWFPRWRVEETLTATAEWYNVYLNNGDIETITRKQLHEYFNELK